MPVFSRVWGDIEDPGAGPDLVANAAFIQGGLDACAGRIQSGVYGNEGSIQRIVGADYQFTGYPYWRASDDGVADVNNVPTNGMQVTYEQFALDRDWAGHKVDINVRTLPDGTKQYGVDLSNWSQVPDAAWFAALFNDANLPIRFIVFGDQMPFVARAQAANAEASGMPFDYELYTYFNMPGGAYYANEDGATQMRLALDAMGVQPAAPAIAGASADIREINVGDGRLIVETEIVPALEKLHTLLAGDGRIERS